jgi:DNA helicase HerA-like ATPase
VVINLSNFGSQNDKALITALLTLSLNEYRKSRYKADKTFRDNADKNKLNHLTVVEESHNILQKPQADYTGVGNAQKAVADLFSNILSEIRGYGQGIMLIDQIPSRLIQDAVKNTNYKIVHRLTSREDAEIMGVSMNLRPEQVGVIPSLDKYDVLAYGDADDAAVWIRVEVSS